MVWRKSIWLRVAVFLSAVCSSGAEIPLSGAEAEWLQTHPVVQIAFDGAFPPYSFVNDAGKLEGYSVQMVEEISRRSGIQFEPVLYEAWDALYSDAKNRTFDVTATMVSRPDRYEWFSFSQPYIFKSLMIVTRDDYSGIRHRKDLAGKKVALVKSYQYGPRILAEFPSVEPLYVDTMLDALNAVSASKAEAAITFQGSGYYLKLKYQLANLKFSATYDADCSPECFGVRRDWPELTSIIGKALASIPAHEKLRIQKKWLPTELLAEIPEIHLTQEERQWIRDHPLVRYSIDPEFAPFEYLDQDGNPLGIASDYIRILNNRLGLNLQYTSGLSWKESVEKAESREIDVLPCVGLTAQREKFMNYSGPYVEFHRVIITRTDHPLVSHMNHLQNSTVAVQANSSHSGFMEEHTDIAVRSYPTMQAALLATASGEVDAFIGNVASSTYFIRKLNLTNLKVAAPVMVEPQSLHFAVRNDWPILQGIIQKGLDSISESHRRDIADKWVLVEYAPAIDYTLLWKALGGISLFIFLLLGWIINDHRLKKNLSRAIAETELARKEVFAANGQLSDLRVKQDALVQQRTRELKISRRNFEQAQKMETIGTLASGIAHDFNNILSGIYGELYLAKAQVMHCEPALECVQNADVLAHRAADLSRQLLMFSRKEEHPIETILLPEFLNRSRMLLQTAILSNIQLSYDMEPDDLYVTASQTQLQQMLFNLVINASHALENRPDPEIRIQLSRYTPDSVFSARHPNVQGEYACIKIIDNGSGISEENQANLFKPFFTTKAADKGTGLGLSMVKNTIEEIQGVIDVSSCLGVGTTFSVCLPVDVANHSLEESPAPLINIYRGSGETILLTDQDRPLLQTTTKILTDLGYHVLSAYNAEQAIRYLRQNSVPVQLLITTLLLPGTNGPALIKSAHQIQPDLPVIYLLNNIPKPLQHAAQQYPSIKKPFTIAQLSKTIREALR